MALRGALRRMTPLDRGVVLLLLLAAVFSFLLLGRGEPGRRLVVEQEGRTLFTSPLAADRTVALSGPLGETVLAIRGGGARILSSPCPHKDCMGMGPAARRGDLLACVPNRLLVRIEGEDDGADYDLLSR